MEQQIPYKIGENSRRASIELNDLGGHADVII